MLNTIKTNRQCLSSARKGGQGLSTNESSYVASALKSNDPRGKIEFPPPIMEELFDSGKKTALL